MSETKYLSVVHKPSNNVVTAFKFEHDATWIGRGKDELIATSVYCEEGNEVKMLFIKSFQRANETRVAAYFRKKPGETGLRNNMSGESMGHKLSKENIYSGLYSGQILINGEKLNIDDVSDIVIESRTPAENYVIFDVVVIFKKEDIKYGLGIFFEIQFSRQKDSLTIDRSYDRLLEGFSGTWLFRDNFDSNYKLINNNIVIQSYRKILKEVEEIRENSFIKKINNYGSIIDNKLNNFEDNVLQTMCESLTNFKDDVDSYKNEIIELSNNSINNINMCAELCTNKIRDLSGSEINKLQIENSQLNQLKDIASNLDINELKNYADIIRKDLVKSSNELIYKLQLKIKEKDKEVGLIYEKINSWKLGEVGINRRDGLLEKSCPECKKDMKIGKAMGGHNWYCSDFPRCSGFIEGVNNEN